MKKSLFLLEIFVFYSLLVGINYFFTPELPGFIGLSPHPFWLGILLFGFRYGLMAGLLSGLFSSFLYLVSIWFFGERYLFEDFIFYFLPSFFVMGGIFIGIGTNRYRTDILKHASEKKNFQKDMNGLNEEIKSLKEINKELEKRIVTRMSTLVTLYEGARRLESVNLNELYRSILDFIVKTLGADEAALYLKSDNGWLVKENFGWKDYKKWPEQYRENEGIVGLAVSSAKIVSVRDFVNFKDKGTKVPELLGDCLFAGPLRRGEGGEIIGVVSIQNMPFLSFNSASLNLFSFLMTWASRSIERAVYVQALRSSEIIDPEFQVYSYRYFESRGVQEFSRSKTYYLPLSVGLVQVDGLQKLSEKKKVYCLTAISQVIKNLVRDMDVVSKFPDEKIPFSFLLVTASEAQAKGIKNKMELSFNDLFLSGEVDQGFAVSVRIGISCFTPKITDFKALVLQAKENITL